METKATTWIHTITCGPKSHTQNSHHTSTPLVADCLKALHRVAGLLAQQIQNSSALAEAANISATQWADPQLLLQGLNLFRVCASLGVLPQPLGTVWKFPISYTPLLLLIILCIKLSFNLCYFYLLIGPRLLLKARVKYVLQPSEKAQRSEVAL